MPSVIQGLGYTSANAQLLTIPIYVFAAILTLIFAWASDLTRKRSPYIIAGYSIAVCGFIAQLAIPKPKYPGITYGFTPTDYTTVSALYVGTFNGSDWDLSDKPVSQ